MEGGEELDEVRCWTTKEEEGEQSRREMERRVDRGRKLDDSNGTYFQIRK